MKSPALLSLRRRCAFSPVAVSGLVLVVFALVMRALIPVGYMPSGANSNPFELSVCFSHAGTAHPDPTQASKQRLASVSDDTAPEQLAAHTGACIFSSTPPLSDGIWHGSSLALQATSPGRATSSSLACPNRSSRLCGPPLGSRAPPVS